MKCLTGHFVLEYSTFMTYSRLKYQKSLLFSKHCILKMVSSIFTNVGTLSKPNDCLSESSWKLT